MRNRDDMNGLTARSLGDELLVSKESLSAADRAGGVAGGGRASLAMVSKAPLAPQVIFDERIYLGE